MPVCTGRRPLFSVPMYHRCAGANVIKPFCVFLTSFLWPCPFLSLGSTDWHCAAGNERVFLARSS